MNVYNNTAQAVIARLDGVLEWRVQPLESVTLVDNAPDAQFIAILDPSTCTVLAQGDLAPGPTAVVISSNFTTPPSYSLSIRTEDAIMDIPARGSGMEICSN